MIVIQPQMNKQNERNIFCKAARNQILGINQRKDGLRSAAGAEGAVSLSSPHSYKASSNSSTSSLGCEQLRPIIQLFIILQLSN